LQNIANNLPNTFTDYKGVTKSLHPTRKVQKEWRYLIKPLNPILANKGGETLPISKM
jgi:hypothetical protein